MLSCYNIFVSSLPTSKKEEDIAKIIEEEKLKPEKPASL